MIKRPYNICIVEPKGFGHSKAFEEVAEALDYSLKELGYPTALSVNRVTDDAVNIIFGAHLLPLQDLHSLHPSTIIVNAEPLSATSERTRERVLICLNAGLEIWDYSPANIEILNRIGGRPVKYLQLGFQKELDRIAPAPVRDIDVLFYGSMNERRAEILYGLQARGLVIEHLFDVYGRERDAWIARSKVVLNMHLLESQIFEVVRVFYLLINGVAVVGEVNGPETLIDERFAQGIVAASYNNLVDVTEQLVRDAARLENQRILARDAIKRHPQVTFTQQLL
ncbi:MULTISPECIES: hypothetical protein [Rhizobium/Agrobacterium group]|uniref:hypothetical protein n=1 Tax=Rhizobium/Agrobacterium group TaxID=227290 RepID=UPI000B406840|nr:MULTISPECIES: hypothetical protein [Rhizobium/Agrobacterium group]MCF1481887.1 hypothetical protein [Allorhizobium ampelinum]NSZ42340.1 hypothetical protein [Agrobacterium vitis]NTA26048.1 hypothetical protein [Allorhizobium ampelinum]OVE95768.1 hypothetical protein B7W85_05965 [Allorhizobium ampelinum]